MLQKFGFHTCDCAAIDTATQKCPVILQLFKDRNHAGISTQDVQLTNGTSTCRIAAGVVIETAR